MEMCPATIEKLSPDELIVHSPFLRRSLLKFKGRNFLLLRKKKTCAGRIRKSWVYSKRIWLWVMTCILRNDPWNIKNGCIIKEFRFHELAHFSTIFHTCASLFWKVGHSINPRRRSPDPTNLETQLFWHLNIESWQCRCYVVMPLHPFPSFIETFATNQNGYNLLILVDSVSYTLFK